MMNEWFEAITPDVMADLFEDLLAEARAIFPTTDLARDLLAIDLVPGACNSS